MNPFEAPADHAPVEKPAEKPVGDLLLAHPGTRFGARMIDALATILGALPGIFVFAIGIESETFAILGAALMGLGMLGVTCYNYWLITTEGTTIGKRSSNIRIVTNDGDPVGFLNGVVVREWAVPLMNLPIALFTGAGFLNLIDALMIFTAGHRTLHDHIAGTKVVTLYRGSSDSSTADYTTEDDFLNEL